MCSTPVSVQMVAPLGGVIEPLALFPTPSSVRKQVGMWKNLYHCSKRARGIVCSVVI